MRRAFAAALIVVLFTIPSNATASRTISVYGTASRAAAVAPRDGVVPAATCPREVARNSLLGIALPLPVGWQEARPNWALPDEMILLGAGDNAGPRLEISSLGPTHGPNPAHAATVAAARLAQGNSHPVTHSPITVAGAPGVLLVGLPSQVNGMPVGFANVQIVFAHGGALYRLVLFGSATLTGAQRAVLASIRFIPRLGAVPPSLPAMPRLPGPFPTLGLDVESVQGGFTVQVRAAGRSFRPNEAIALHLCWQGTLRPGTGAARTSYTLDRAVHADVRGTLDVTLTVPMPVPAFAYYTVRVTAHDARIGNALKTTSGLIGSGRPGSGPASCPPVYRDVPAPPGTAGAIDWIDFVHFHDIDYVNPVNPQGRALRPSDLGPRFATVCFNVADHVEVPTYVTKDGDAAFLAPGTPVYAVKGYRPTFRLAAWDDGRLTLYEADANPRARTGGDLLDVGGKVRYIGINSPQDGTTEIAAITDPRRVAHLIGLVLAAPVTHHPMDENGSRYFIEFHLKDGTAVTRAYWPDTGELSRSIMLPPAFRAAVQRAVHGAGS